MLNFFFLKIGTLIVSFRERRLGYRERLFFIERRASSLAVVYWWKFPHAWVRKSGDANGLVPQTRGTVEPDCKAVKRYRGAASSSFSFSGSFRCSGPAGWLRRSCMRAAVQMRARLPLSSLGGGPTCKCSLQGLFLPAVAIDLRVPASSFAESSFNCCGNKPSNHTCEAKVLVYATKSRPNDGGRML